MQPQDDEILLSVATWMKMIDLILSVVNQKSNGIYYMFSIKCGIENTR